jgi:hypothetical protein
VRSWMAALGTAASTLASTSPAPAIAVLAIGAVLALNYYASLALQWNSPSEDGTELFLLPIAVAPVAGLILACLHALLPRYRWPAALGLFVLTAALMQAWVILLIFPHFGIPSLLTGAIGYFGSKGTWLEPQLQRVRPALVVLALALLTYANVLATAYIPGVRAVVYPWRVVTVAMREERDRLLAIARDVGVDPKKKMTEAQMRAMLQRMGEGRVVEVPWIGRSVRIRQSHSPTLDLTMFWDDGRFGRIDLETLEVPLVSD